MIRTGRILSLGCLLLFSPLTALAGGNTLLIPATARCALNTLPEELPEALRSCQQAASEGDVQAAYELGEFHYDGRRAPRDLAKALYWFEQASLRGHAAAQHRLGVMFFRGEGVKANNVQAYIVLKMAAVNGEDEALDTADRVSAQMRRDELEIATQVLGQIFRDYLMQLQAADAPLIP
ncbi:MAG TPA: sel1 repeat family protein [Pseudomonas sp.]|nr:sel1 repeat family protein [Pseudomonas sp.]